MNINGTATTNAIIQASPTAGSYPTGTPATTHWRILSCELSLIGSTTVNDVEINSYNPNTSTVTQTLFETGALGVAGGHQEWNPGDSDKGDCASLDAIQIASSNWNGGAVAYRLTITQIA